MALAAAATAPAAGARDFAPRQWLAMLFVVCCGFSSQMVMPLWIGAVVKSLHLSEAAAGRIGSLEFLAVAALSVIVALKIEAFPTRRTVMLGVALLVLGNIGAAFAGSEGALIAARVLCGVGKGMVVAIVFALAAGSARPTRAFALLNLVYALFATFFYLVVPYAIAAGGAAGAFLAMAGVAVAGAGLMPLFPAARLAGGELRGFSLRAIPPYGYAAFAALMILWSGHSMIWTFVARIGARDGIDVATVGRILSVAAALTILGPGLARLIDTRLGHAVPVVAAIALDALAAWAIGHDASLAAFAIAVPALMLLTLFITPYVMGILSIADPAGRLAAVSSAAMTAGGSAGAWLGGMALGAGGPPALSLGTILHFAVFAGLILLAVPLAARTRALAPAA